MGFSQKPLTALIPEHDDFLPLSQARARFRAVPHAEVVVVEGAKHLLFGRTETVLSAVVDRVLPQPGRTRSSAGPH